MINVTIVDTANSVLLNFVGTADATLIEQMENHAFDMPYSCRAGACMTCAVVVKRGKEHILQEFGGEKFIDTDDDQILTCIAGLSKDSVESEEAFDVILEMIDMY